MLIPQSYITIASVVCVGIPMSVLYYKRYKDIFPWWLLHLLTVLLINFGSVFLLSMTFWGICPRIMVIDSETSWKTCYFVGQNNDYLIDLTPWELYVLNKTQDTILIHTVYVEYEDKKDYLVLKPERIGLVHQLPTLFFEGSYDKVWVSIKPSQRHNINAVDYYNRKE